MKIFKFLQSHKVFLGVLTFVFMLSIVVPVRSFAADRYQVGYFRPSNTDSPYWKLYVNSNTSFESALGQASEYTQTSESVNYPYSDSYYFLVALYDLGLESYFSNPVSNVPFYCNWDYLYLNNDNFWLLTLTKDNCYSSSFSVSFPTSAQSIISYDFPFVLSEGFRNPWNGNSWFSFPLLPSNYQPYTLSSSTSLVDVYPTYHIFGGGSTAASLQSGSDFAYILNRCTSYSSFNALGITLSNFIDTWLNSDSDNPFYIIYSFDSSSLKFYCSSFSMSLGRSLYLPNFVLGQSNVSGKPALNCVHLASSFTTFILNDVNYSINRASDWLSYGFGVSSSDIVNFSAFPFIPSSFALLPESGFTPTPVPTSNPPFSDVTPTPVPSHVWLTPTPFPSVSPVPVTLTPIPQYINPDLDIDSTEVKSALSGYLDIIDETFSNFAIFALGSQILSYLYSFSPYFSFVLLIPAICLIAYAIGRLNQK